MRLLILLAIVCLIIAFVCYVVPTALLFGALGWFILGMLFWAVDVAVGGWAVAAPTVTRRV